MTRKGSEREAPTVKEPAPKGAQQGPVAQARTGFDWFRENAEALIVAVILAVIIRHFAVEAFEIPTGSMANSLYGIHAWLDCPNCTTKFNASLKTDPTTGKLTGPYGPLIVLEEECPDPRCTLSIHSRGPQDHSRGPQDYHLRSPGELVECGSCKTRFRGQTGNYKQVSGFEEIVRCPICHFTYRAVIEESNRTGGHKILVTKFEYAFGKPRRWDVIVFGFDQWKNYIKRLVGLPGERINVWDGDLYVNGKIERKSDHPYAQDALWTRISDSDVPENGLNTVPAWEEVALPGTGRTLASQKFAQWNQSTLRWSVNVLEDTCVLDYRRGFDNYYAYNLLSPQSYGVGSSPPGAQVGDKKVVFTATVAKAASPAAKGGGWVGAEIRDWDFTFQLRIPVGQASGDRPAVLERVGEGAARAPLRATKAVAIPPGTAAVVELENADDRVIARLDGKVILSIDYVSLPEGAPLASLPEPRPGALESNHLRLMASGVQAELQSIRAFRDMYYIARLGQGDHWPGIQLGEGQYLAMGDNAPSSSDGRYWGYIPEKNLMGKALLVFWPIWSAYFQWKFIR